MSSYLDLPHKFQIILLVLCRLAEPLAFTSISPYIYYMIRDFGYDDPSRISFLVTIVTSSFSLGQALTAVFWGKFSDDYGRKPALLLGLIGTTFSVLIFGLSRNIYFAILGRLLAGMLNGNIGVMRTIIAELLKDDKRHQTRGFAILPMTFNIGSIIGPVIGGFLANPVKNFPKLFGNSKLLAKYPYLLPNLFPVPILLFSLIMTTFFTRETNVHSNYNDWGIRIGDRFKAKFLGMPTNVDKKDIDETEPLLSDSSQPSSSQVSVAADKTDKSLKAILTHPVKVTLVSFVVLMLHCPSYLQLLPLFLATPQIDDPVKGIFFNGGLGWPTTRIGLLMSVLGFSGIILQVFVYPDVANFFGNARVHKLSLLAFPITYFTLPFLSFLSDKSDNAAFIAILPLCILVVVGRTFAIPPMTILMTNAAPSHAVMGTVHGLTHSVVSVARCVGPFILGNLYSLSIKIDMIGLAFWVMTIVVLIEIYISRQLREWGQEDVYDEDILEVENDGEVDGYESFVDTTGRHKGEESASTR